MKILRDELMTSGQLWWSNCGTLRRRLLTGRVVVLSEARIPSVGHMLHAFWNRRNWTHRVLLYKSLLPFLLCFFALHTVKGVGPGWSAKRENLPEWYKSLDVFNTRKLFIWYSHVMFFYPLLALRIIFKKNNNCLQ